MLLTPSEKQAAIAAAKKIFTERHWISIFEPCNCGSRVMHNNGSNYHDIIDIDIREDGELYIRYGTTSMLEAEAEWERADDGDIDFYLDQFADWLPMAGKGAV